MLKELHKKTGDFWWYSILIFTACRSGDIIQAFIGLWLVPRYVGQDELGVVLPLQQLCGLFAVPLSVLAVVFSKYVNTYATHGEYGKVKSFILDVLLTASFIFTVSIGLAYITIPHFYDRLRISSGSLTLLVLAAGLTGNISSLLNNALQGLKQFKTLTIVNMVAAPIRLITLIIAMPFRALSGYLLGQVTPSAVTSIIAAFAIHRKLHKIKPDISWRSDIPKILCYLWPVAIFTTFTALFGTISATVYRQRLPEIESSAYYLISRFAETAGYIGVSMMVILFPLAAEAHEKGEEDTSSMWRTIAVTLISTVILSSTFAVTGSFLFSLTEIWHSYLPYINLLPWTTLTIGMGTTINIVVSYEMACRRFGIPFFIIIFNLLITTILVSFTGWDFYRGILSDSLIAWIATHNLSNLTRLTWFNGISAAIQLIILFIVISYRTKSKKT